MNKLQAQQCMEKVRNRLSNLRSTQTVAPKQYHLKAGPKAGLEGTHLYIYDTIGGWDGIFASDVVNALVGVTGELVVHINSGGGGIFEGVAIHNAIKNYDGDVTVRIDGIAASAASFIAMAGDKIIIESNASMMIHDGWDLCIGNAADMRETADLLDMVSNTIAEMYAARTGKTVEEYRKKMAKDTWYNATEAVAEGLADEVAGAAAGAENKLDLSLFNYTPKIDPKTDDVAGSFAAFKEAIK